ncbi:cupin domain-containing protein [Hymenobacter sp. B81]|uniref:cupin domain-containing protein n=1 Tax=Hymenobacter sp. B81 TaxID=3344878 RepID=UPI0037DCF32D
MKRRTFLQTTAAAVPLITLAPLGAAGASAEQPFVVKAGRSRRNEVLTFRQVNSQDVKVSTADTGGVLSVLEYTGREKTGPPLHVHYEQDEVFYVVEGQYRFVVGGEQFVAAAGDTVFLPRNVPHTWIQLTETGRQLYLLQPAGQFEAFLRTMQNLKQVPTAEELQRIHLAHGMRVLGPPLQL